MKTEIHASLEVLEDLLFWSKLGIKIESMDMLDEHTVRFKVSADNVPDEARVGLEYKLDEDGRLLVGLSKLHQPAERYEYTGYIRDRSQGIPHTPQD